jgi:hypothetical protein
MQKPNKEQILYAQLGIAYSIIDYIGDNLEDTIFLGKGIEAVTKILKEGMEILRLGMDKSFDEAKGVNNVRD